MQFLHESVYETVLEQLVGVYKQVKVGDPLEKGTLVGPLHTRASRENFEKGISTIKSQACVVCFETNLTLGPISVAMLHLTYSNLYLRVTSVSREGRS